MRAHIARHHPKEHSQYSPVSVQVFYDRTALRPQLSYVEVSETGQDQPRVRGDSVLFGIPADLDDVGGHHQAVEARDRNLFGENFGAYYLIENVMIDFEELSPWFLAPTAKGFTELKKITVMFLDDCWKPIKSGFQPIQSKIMMYDDKKQFLHSVQQRHTAHNYSEIWAKVIWLACIATMERPPSIATGIILTDEQREYATQLLRELDTVTSDVGEDQSRRIGQILAELGMAILHQQSDSVILINEDGVSEASLLIVPWAINLLSLRPNGTFVKYGQITHNVAAISYCLRSIFFIA